VSRPGAHEAAAPPAQQRLHQTELAQRDEGLQHGHRGTPNCAASSVSLAAAPRRPAAQGDSVPPPGGSPPQPARSGSSGANRAARRATRHRLDHRVPSTLRGWWNRNRAPVYPVSLNIGLYVYSLRCLRSVPEDARAPSRVVTGSRSSADCADEREGRTCQTRAPTLPSEEPTPRRRAPSRPSGCGAAQGVRPECTTWRGGTGSSGRRSSSMLGRRSR